MRASQFLISTLKEAPADAEVASHQLMMRAGMIKKLGAGIYTYMPMGLRVIRKVEAIVREEMNRAGAVHFLTHDGLHFADHAQAHGHVGVDTGAELFDHACAHHQLVAGHLGVGRSLLEGGNQELGCSHGNRSKNPGEYHLAGGGLPCIMA